jgi:hypothetical protein
MATVWCWLFRKICHACCCSQHNGCSSLLLLCCGTAGATGRTGTGASATTRQQCLAPTSAARSQRMLVARTTRRQVRMQAVTSECLQPYGSCLLVWTWQSVASLQATLTACFGVPYVCCWLLHLSHRLSHYVSFIAMVSLLCHTAACM